MRRRAFESFFLAALLALGGASPSRAAERPRPLSEQERQAVRLVADYLARGPEAFWEALSTRAPLRALGREEGLKEIEARTGKRDGSRWELRTPSAGAGRVALFGVDFPSGLDTVLLLDMVEEKGAWRLHSLRSLAEAPPALVWSQRAANPPKIVPPPPSWVPAAALAGAALLFPLAFVVRKSRLAAITLFFTAAAAAAFFGGVLLQMGWGRALRPEPLAPQEPAFVRLAPLAPLRTALETQEPREAAQLLADVKDQAARDVGSQWLAQKSMQAMALDEATEFLKGFRPPVRVPWAEVLRARLAFLKNQPAAAAVSYQNAEALGPLNDGLIIEAHDACSLLGFDVEAENQLERLAQLGSRSSDVWYRLTQQQLSKEKPEDAEKSFLVGWSLRPAERSELLAFDNAWQILRRPSIKPSLRLDRVDEMIAAAPISSPSLAVEFPKEAQLHVCARYLRVEVGEAALEVPGGAELAPPGTQAEDAAAAGRIEDERALARFDALSKSLSVGSFSSPLLRRQIRRTVVALARRHRWREVASLTAGLAGADEQVPPDILMMRAEALRRTRREEMAKRLLVDLAKSPTLEKRGGPGVLYRLGEMFAAIDDFDRAIKFVQKGGRASRKEWLDERVKQLRTEQRLVAQQAVYTTAHYEVHYPPNMPERLAAETARILELERERVEKWIPSEVVKVVPVQLLKYEEFQTFAGGSDSILGLYDGKIRVPLAGVVHWVPPLVAIMTHELAHAMIAQATDDRAPHWFQEGLAQHLEMQHYHPNHVGDYRRDQTALSIPAIEEVLRAFSDPELIEEAYHEADWLLEYVEQKHGIKGIQRMIEGFRDGLSTEEVVKRALGVPLSTFNDGFLDWASVAPKMVTVPVKSYMYMEDDISIKVKPRIED